MKKKSLFSRISKSLQGEEKTSEELDRELEEALASIDGEAVEEVDAAAVISTRIGEAGGPVFIMSLPPLYKAIGTNTGRMAENLKESCHRIFQREVSPDIGHGVLEGEFFVMSFSVDMKIGFQLAVNVINAVGTHILLDRFKAMKVPKLLTVADASDVLGEDGKLAAGKIMGAVKNGGRRIEAKAYDPDDPQWYYTFCNDNANLTADFGETQTREEKIADWGTTEEIKFDDQAWTAIKSHERNGKELIEHGKDRRQSKKKGYGGKERRTSWRPRRMEDSMRV